MAFACCTERCACQFACLLSIELCTETLYFATVTSVDGDLQCSYHELIKKNICCPSSTLVTGCNNSLSQEMVK